MNAQNLAVVQQPAKPIETVRQTLEKMKPQFAMALPKHLTPDRLLRVAMTSIQNTPKLLECDRTSLFAAIMMCAQLGLEPDGVLGQAYLVPFAGKVQFIPGYKGLISLARNTGEVVSIQAHEVRERDEFDYAFGLNEVLTHKPARGQRGEITYFYAIAKFKDGGYHWDVMSVEEVLAIRDKSSGWKSAVANAEKYKKPNTSPWQEHFAEMGKKTAIRRIAKYLPMSVQRAVAVEDNFEAGKHVTIDSYGEILVSAPEQAASPQISQASDKMQAFESGAAPAAAQPKAETIHPETGEVTPAAAPEPAAQPGNALDKFDEI